MSYCISLKHVINISVSFFINDCRNASRCLPDWPIVSCVNLVLNDKHIFKSTYYFIRKKGLHCTIQRNHANDLTLHKCYLWDASHLGKKVLFFQILSFKCFKCKSFNRIGYWFSGQHAQTRLRATSAHLEP